MPQPIYNRSGPRFEDLFQASPDEVVGSMDRAGDNVPEKKPHWPLRLNAAGLVRERIPVRVEDPFHSGATTVVNCRLSVSTHVPHDKRGIHMSRLNHVIAESVIRTCRDLDEYTRQLAEAVNHCQYDGPSEVRVDGWLSYWESVAGRHAGKEKLSLEEIGLSATARLGRGSSQLTSGLSFDHLTACPCVQKMLQHARRPGDATADADRYPAVTHSQRCRSYVSVSNHAGTFPLARLLKEFDKVVFRTQNTLPREHELKLVYLAHEQPQFIEDVVRELVLACHRVLRAEHPDCRVEVSSSSMESIHSFDIHASAAVAIRELDGVQG